jgi:thiol:disulfide interchange protein DsbG
MRLKSFAGMLVGLMLSFPAAAAIDAKDIPPVLKAAQNRMEATLDVLQRFDAGGGLVGWLVNDNGQEAVVYTTADGRYLVLGALIDEEMKNLTVSHREKYGSKPDLSEAWKAAESMHWIPSKAKKGAPVVYAFVDMRCGACRLFWRQAQILADKVEFRFIPVAILGEQSYADAAGLIEAKEPLALLQDHYSEKEAPLPASGKKESVQVIMKNTAFMGTLNLSATPSLLFKNSKGEVRTRVGAPTAVELEELLGL